MSRRDYDLWFLPPLWREQEAAENERLAAEAETARSRGIIVRVIGRRARELNEAKAQQ